jgi:5-methylcytosine-specific restriction endonuclease McrA
MESAKQTTQASPDIIEELVRVRWFKDKSLIAVLARADFRCEYCGQDLILTFNDCFNAQKDHIIPTVKGGSNDESNLAACCLTCNTLKWDYVPAGSNRNERISDAAKHLVEQRKKQEEFWNKYRNLLKR